VSVTAWRIVQRKFAKTTFDAEGARLYGGRWNSPGFAIVYTAQSQSLAALELLVHLDSESILQNYLAIPVTIPQNLILELDKSKLPNGWAAYPASKETRHLGDAWATERKSPVLQVPSAVIPIESNFLLNPAHPNFPDLIIGNPMNFKFDPRLSTSG